MVEKQEYQEQKYNQMKNEFLKQISPLKDLGIASTGLGINIVKEEIVDFIDEGFFCSCSVISKDIAIQLFQYICLYNNIKNTGTIICSTIEQDNKNEQLIQKIDLLDKINQNNPFYYEFDKQKKQKVIIFCRFGKKWVTFIINKNIEQGYIIDFSVDDKQNLLKMSSFANDLMQKKFGMEKNENMKWEMHSQQDLESKPYQIAIANLFFLDKYLELQKKNDKGLVDLSLLKIEKNAQYEQKEKLFMFYVVFLALNPQENIIQEKLKKAKEKHQEEANNFNNNKDQKQINNNNSQQNLQNKDIQLENSLLLKSNYSPLNQSKFLQTNNQSGLNTPKQINKSNIMNVSNYTQRQSDIKAAKKNNFQRNQNKNVSNQNENAFLDNIAKIAANKNRLNERQQQLLQNFTQMQEQEQKAKQLQKQISIYDFGQNNVNNNNKKNEINSKIVNNSKDPIEQKRAQAIQQNNILINQTQNLLKENMYIKSQFQTTNNKILNLGGQIEYFKSKDNVSLQSEKFLPDKIYQDYLSFQQSTNKNDSKNRQIVLNYNYENQQSQNNVSPDLQRKEKPVSIPSGKIYTEEDTVINYAQQESSKQYGFSFEQEPPAKKYSVHSQQTTYKYNNNNNKNNLVDAVQEKFDNLLQERYQKKEQNGNKQQQIQLQANQNYRQHSYSLNQEKTQNRNYQPFLDNNYYQ